MKMKRVLNHLFVVLFAALVSVSCDLDADYSHTAVLSATFEYSAVEFDADSLYYKSDFGAGIGWGTLGFLHNVDTTSWEFHGGAVLSCQQGTRFDSSDLAQEESLVLAQNRFRVNAAKDTVNTNTYLVYYLNPNEEEMPKNEVVFLVEQNGACVAQQCLVNNTGYVAYKVAQTFQAGDRLTLQATGYLKGAKTGDASMLLADFSTKKDSIVSTWTAFDLSKLGNFDAIDFEVISTNDQIPPYFCMDNFTASVTVSSGI